MEKVEITWDKVILVWWSYTWRVLLYTAILIAILAVIGALIFFSIGMPEFGRKYGAIAAQLAIIPVSILVLKKILSKKFNGYSVALVKDDNL